MALEQRCLEGGSTLGSQVVLDGVAHVLGQSGLAHAGEADWDEEEFGDSVHRGHVDQGY